MQFIHNTSNGFVTEQYLSTLSNKQAINTLNPSILIIDDEEVCITSLSLMLYNSPYNILATNSGKAGLEYANLYHYDIDLILLDLMLPDIYGLDVLIKLKQSDTLKHISVLIQSATIKSEELENSLQLGAYSYLRNPYCQNALLSKMELALNAKTSRFNLY